MKSPYFFCMRLAKFRFENEKAEKSEYIVTTYTRGNFTYADFFGCKFFSCFSRVTLLNVCGEPERIEQFEHFR